MERLLRFALVGLAAQLVDGALGMGYGATSATLLLGAGTAPLAASASIHLAEVGTTLLSGAAHWRFGNVDWEVVRAIAVPGAVGAFAGALVLSSIDADVAAPLVAAFLFVLGAFVLARFAFGAVRQGRPHSRRFLGGLGSVAGFLDAVGGGGWGPIATPTLLANGHLSPRRVVGSVSAAEFVVTVAASLGFLVAITRGSLDLVLVAALLAGGLVAAPLAAWLVRFLHPRILGTAVGGMILLTNARTVASVLDAGPGVRLPAYVAIVTVWAVALVAATRAIRRDRAAASPAAAGPLALAPAPARARADRPSS